MADPVLKDEITAENIVEKVNLANKELADNLRSEFKELEEKAKADPLLDEKITKINDNITELRAKQDAFELKAQRPSANNSSDSDQTPEQRAKLETFEQFIRGGMASLNADQQRSLASAPDTAGGYTIPIDFERQILMNEYNAAELRGICRVSTTSRDTVITSILSQPIMSWGTKGIEVTAQDINAGNRELKIRQLVGLAIIADDTLDDSEANIWNELYAGFSQSQAEEEDRGIIIGDNIAEMEGILTNTAVTDNFTLTGVSGGYQDADNNGLNAFTRALYKVKKTYRQNGHWAFASRTEAEVRTFVDKNGNQQWQPRVTDKTPDMFLGYPIVNPEAMPTNAADDSLADGLITALFGDFNRGYSVKDRTGLSVKRLDEKYAEYLSTGFLVTKRVGGKVMMPEAFSCLKIGA